MLVVEARREFLFAFLFLGLCHVVFPQTIPDENMYS
jgi:hypothetical protein